MIKAYKKYLRKNVSNKKYYAIVNIGDNNAPVLLRGTQGAGNDKTGRHYTGCQIYYYKNGKVVKMDTFKDGGRWLLLSKKDGQNYLTNGGSDFSIRICVKNGNLYRYQYYNNHNWKKNPENKWATFIVKMNGRSYQKYGISGWDNVQKTYRLLYLFKESRNQLYKECEITSACSYFTNLLGDLEMGAGRIGNLFLLQ